MRVEDVPDVNLTPLPSYVSSIEAPFPSLTEERSISTGFPFASVPVRVSSAPASSTEPSMSVLLIFMSVILGRSMVSP